MMHLCTHHDSQKLPDSGADASSAGEHILLRLNEHKNNLLPSEFTPSATNGQKMHAIGKMCVCFQLASEEDVYIFTH